MKLTLILLTLLTSLSTYAGTANCRLVETWHNTSMVIAEGTNLTCIDEVNEKSYFITLRGVGAALKLPEQGKYTVTCPGIKNMAGNYFGIRTSANLFYGANAGVFIGKGACFIGGLTMTIGLSLEGARLKIQDLDEAYDDMEKKQEIE